MHYIYLLYDNKNPLRFFSYELHKLGRKIGSTCNVKTRIKPYLTGHPDKVPLECYYKILNPEKYSCYQIDEMIKDYFHEYNLKGNGGIEFYEEDKVNQEALEKFFDLKEILWEKSFEVIDEDIHTITKEDIQNISYDIENSNFYKKDNINCWNQLYTWQKEAIEECKKFFDSNEKAGLIIAPTGTGKSYLMNYISICYYVCKTGNDVIIMTKRKEILDNDFINEGNKFIKQLNLKCEFVNLINLDEKHDNTIFSKKNENARIFIINVDKFISSNKFSSYENYSFGKVKLLLFDECHWCGATEIFSFINYMKKNIVDKVIGFSATPIRQEEENKKNSFELFKDVNNSYNVIYIRSYLDSIDEGNRVKTNWIIIKTTTKNLQKEDNLDEFTISRCLNIEGFKDFTNKLNNFLTVNQSICGKGILWFPNIKNLVDYYNFIIEKKEDYNMISNTEFFPTYSKTKEYPDVSSNLQNFKNKEKNAILLSVYRATEGFDDKPIDFGFNVYTVKSSNPLLDQQKEGRVSRNYSNKLCGYFGFLVNEDFNETEESDNIAKRLADWISYMEQFENLKNEKDKKKEKSSKIKTFQDYLNIIIDSKNFEKIEFDKIKKKIFKYVEKIENGITSANTIKRIIQKENKKRLVNNLELIDTKEKYDIYAADWGLTLSDEITMVENNNWVKLMRPDFNEFIKEFYTWDELKYLCDINRITTFLELKNFTITKIPKYYLNSGIYNINKIVNFIDIYYNDNILV